MSFSNGATETTLFCFTEFNSFSPVFLVILLCSLWRLTEGSLEKFTVLFVTVLLTFAELFVAGSTGELHQRRGAKQGLPWAQCNRKFTGYYGFSLLWRCCVCESSLITWHVYVFIERNSGVRILLWLFLIHFELIPRFLTHSLSFLINFKRSRVVLDLQGTNIQKCFGLHMRTCGMFYALIKH